MSVAQTSTTAATVRVVAAVEPFLLRTALHRVLSRDDRFEVVLHPAGAPFPPAVASHDTPTVVLTTRPLDLPGVCVVAVDPATGDVHVDGDGPCAAHRYEDLDALGELLHWVLVDRGLVARPADFDGRTPSRRQGD